MKGGVRTPGNMFESKETNPCRRQTSMFYPLLEDITSRKWMWNCITTATCSVNLLQVHTYATERGRAAGCSDWAAQRFAGSTVQASVIVSNNEVTAALLRGIVQFPDTTFPAERAIYDLYSACVQNKILQRAVPV